MKELLETLAKLLGIQGEPHHHETREQWKYFGEVPADPAAFAEFEKLVPQLQGRIALFRVRRGDWILFDLETPSFDDLREAIAAFDSPLTLDVKVVKPPGLFFFPQALARFLSQPLTGLDSALTFVVPSHDIELVGPYLSVTRRALPAPPPAEEPPTFELARKHTNWVLQLTPMHLAFEARRVANDDPIASALHAQWFACSVIYLARQARWDEETKRWTCIFASERQEIAVDVGALTSLPASRWADARALGELACWVHEKERDADDRLIVVQRIVVDALQNNPAEILDLAGEISRRARWGWESFVAGELKKYLSQMKELEETVEKTTRDYGDQVQGLTKTTIDNMLAAVAVIVGSFLVAMFKSPFHGDAFRFGIGVYSIYLFLFPMLVGLTATWQRFQKSRSTFAMRRKSFAQRLTAAPVDAIVEPVIGKSEAWFRRWFGTTVAIYAVVLIVLVAAAVLVPRWMSVPAGQ